MPTILSHAICGAALAQVISPRSIRREMTIVASVCAMLPDLDVAGLRFGVAYGSLFGHRGLTHSILFAAATAFAVAFSRTRVGRIRVLLTIFAATLSHGILDAFTNGGLGVAFFSPFDAQRIFFPVRPIEVSPLSLEGLMGQRGIEVFRSELLWVWAPSALLAAIGRLRRSQSGGLTT